MLNTEILQQCLKQWLILFDGTAPNITDKLITALTANFTPSSTCVFQVKNHSEIETSQFLSVLYQKKWTL